MKTVIAGGGVAGLYAAWRLASGGRHRPESLVLMHDGSRAALGGRLASLEGVDGSAFNLGAGRISRGQHPRARALIEAMDLETVPFDYRDDLWVIGQARRRRDSLSHQRSPGAGVDARLHDCAPLDWHERAWQLAPQLPGHDTSFVEWISRFVGERHVRTIQHLQGYGILENPELPLSEARRILQQHPETQHGDDWVEPRGGFQAIAHALAARLEALGVEIVDEHRLVSLSRRAGTPGAELVWRAAGRERRLVADRVVLALPPRALSPLAPGLPPEQRRMLDAVSPVPLAKLFVTFDAPWWVDAGFAVGDCVRTDLDLQKVYFRSDGACLVYCDSAAARHWSGLMDADAACPGTLRQALARQLAQVAGVDERLVRIRTVHHRFWPEGVHFWRLGARPEQVHALLLGDPAQGIHICGEAYSPNSGWIEGALESVDALMDRLAAAPVRTPVLADAGR